MTSTVRSLLLPLLACLLAGGCCTTGVGAEATIEDVDAAQLAALVADQDYVAVLWYGAQCAKCDKVLAGLETIDDDADVFNVRLVKCSDAGSSRRYNIKKYPALTYFRSGDAVRYQGDLMDEEEVLKFLTDWDSMQVAGRIEQVNGRALRSITDAVDYVAAVVCHDQCHSAIIDDLETIDDEADDVDIALVESSDPHLVQQYAPAAGSARLVFFRNNEPTVFEGDLTDEEAVLRWLIDYKERRDQDQVIEDVTADALDQLIESSAHLAVLFYDGDDAESLRVLAELEHIDDECDQRSVAFVKIDDDAEAKKYGVDQLPALLYLEDGVPSLYRGDLADEQQVLKWLIHNVESAEIEEVTDEILDVLIKKSAHLAVLFYDDEDAETETVLAELEQIDDECDSKGIQFVKIDNLAEAKKYGIDDVPALVYFEDGVPALYEGDLSCDEKVLLWLHQQVDGDEIEDVTDEMLDMLILRKKYLAVLFYDKDEQSSSNVLLELENIDDELDQKGIAFVKIDNEAEAQEYGIEELPALVYFELGIPTVYEGVLSDEDQVLRWLSHQLGSDEIEEVTDEMLDMLIQKKKHLAALFYDDDDETSMKVLAELENIDDECDQKGITFVRIDNPVEAREYGIDTLPALIYFEDTIPNVYKGDLMDEDKVLTWLSKQVTSDEIEEVTNEIMDMLIKLSSKLAVIFYDDDEDSSEDALTELENIDDECDQLGTNVVKIDDSAEAKEYGLDNLPAMVYFENGIPMLYEGDLTNEDEVLKWLTHQAESDEIEDVTDEMLDKLIAEKKHLAVLFYDDDDKKSMSVLAELEKIDDECDQKGIVFVRIDDLEEAKEYGIDSVPYLVYFEDGIPSIYEGDLIDEERVLEWLSYQLENDEIEEVTDEMLDKLIEQKKFLAVLFCDEDEEESTKVLAELENIDDECDDLGISFVMIDDSEEAAEYGVSEPGLIFFENKIPTIYSGDLMIEEEVLAWLTNKVGSDEVEDVTDEILDKLIARVPHLAVLFYEKGDAESETILAELEHIDDECDDKGIGFVKIDNADEAKEYGIEDTPALIYFENGLPSLYTGDLLSEEKVLVWLYRQVNGDEIEDVTEEMLDKLVAEKKHLAVLFYDREEKESNSALAELEKIDDECDAKGVTFVRIDDVDEAQEYGLDDLPALVYFEDGIPALYTGVLEDEEQVLAWLTHQVDSEEISEVTDEILDLLIAERPNLVVLFYDKADEEDLEILQELENIDDECDASGIPFFKIADLDEAAEYGLQKLPALVYFEDKIPNVYSGDLRREEKVLAWLLEQKASDTIETMTDELLHKVINDHDSVGVLFSGTCDSNESCEDVLDDLENIDDDAMEKGIPLVTTDESDLAKSYGITTFPTVAFFRDGKPLIFKGDPSNELAVLEWFLAGKKLFEEASRTGDGQCTVVGLEDETEKGQLRKFQCCPLASAKN